MSKHQISYSLFSIITLIYAIGFVFYRWPIIYYIPLFLIWSAVVLWGSFSIQSNYHIKVICKVKTKQSFIALTFDDGPTEFTPQVLDLLHKYDCKATFFCIGRQLKHNRAIAQRIVGEGHSIGNHTYYHSNNNGFKRKEELVEEWKRTDKIIAELTKKKPLFFRPPFGVTNPHIMRALTITKHQVIGWNIRSLDTVIRSEDRIFKRIVRQLSSGSIVLMHDTSLRSVHVLERLLILMKEKNIKSCTIAELLKLEE